MTKTKTTEKTDLQRAEELMKVYAQSAANKKALMETIANELKAYNENMKEAEKELLEIGERNIAEFDVDGNWNLEHGYIHIASNSVLVTTKKFNAQEFIDNRPEWIEIEKALKLAPIKKAFLDAETRKELKALGIDLTTEQVLKVIV